MPRQAKNTFAVLGIDIGKNSFHLVTSALGLVVCSNRPREPPS